MLGKPDRLLGIALAVYMGLREVMPVQAPGPSRQFLRLMGDLYLWSALLAILGWVHVKLNHPWRWLPWANASVYPWYVLHQTLIIVGIWWLAPLRLGPVLEPILLVAGTVFGCWVLTGWVRRTPWLRPLFGLKRLTRLPHLSPDRPVCPSVHNAG